MNSVFRVIVSGVKNPSQQSITGFNAYFAHNGYKIVYGANIDSIQLNNNYDKGTIQFNTIKSFPINANTVSDYELTFTPAHSLGSGGFIKITFPSA